jgi:hypothetical protein
MGINGSKEGDAEGRLDDFEERVSEPSIASAGAPADGPFFSPQSDK